MELCGDLWNSVENFAENFMERYKVPHKVLKFANKLQFDCNGMALFTRRFTSAFGKFFRFQNFQNNRKSTSTVREISVIEILAR